MKIEYTIRNHFAFMQKGFSLNTANNLLISLCDMQKLYVFNEHTIKRYTVKWDGL